VSCHFLLFVISLLICAFLLILRVFYYLIKYAACQRPPGPLLFNKLDFTSDQDQVSGLCLLDLTAAFDTVDHDLLLQRLDNTFRVRDQAKKWFKSYLTGRSYCVIYGGGTSATVLVTCSVPQGSVLVPLLFILYTAELADLAAVRRQITRIRGRQPATRALRS